MLNSRQLLAGLAMGLLSGTIVHAADLPVSHSQEAIQVQSGEWTFTVAPYFWAAGISGDVGQFGLPTVHISPDFSDILNNLDFAAMAIAEARNDRFSIVGDVMYTKLSVGRQTPLGVLASSANVTSETFAGLLAAGYSVLSSDSGFLDVVAGARIWSAKTELSFSGGLIDGLSASDSATWVDGMAGIRGRYSLTDQVYLTGWGMVGAGGADLDWDVAGAIGYEFNDSIAAIAGYRALGVDYSDDGFVFDVVQQGPILGLLVRF